MNKLAFAFLVIIASCTSSTDTYTTASGVQYKIIHPNKKGVVASIASTVKAIPNTKTDSIHSHLPLYKSVMPPAPYTADPLAEVLMTGVHEGDSLVITDTKGEEISYKIVKVFIPGYQGLNADSLITVDKWKEISLMQQEQLKYGIARVERFVKANNPKAVKHGNVYVEILNKGVAPLADSGRVAGIKFSSRNIHTGEVIASNIESGFNIPAIYEYRVSSGKMYKPVDEIMHQLGKGGKARIYMPAIIVLGEKANNPTTDITQDAVFDVEVVFVK